MLNASCLFSTVAGEIGKLADESARAAGSTRELIGMSINEMVGRFEIE